MSRRKKYRLNKPSKQVKKTEPQKSLLPQKTPPNVRKPHAPAEITFFSKIKGWFWGFLAICGFLISLYVFYPRVSIQRTQLLYPDNPFYYPFEVKNVGKILIRDFSFSLKVTNVTFEGGGSIQNTMMDQNKNDTIIPRIKVNGEHPINLVNEIEIHGINVKSAQVFIKYNYSIPSHIFHFTDSIKFFLIKTPLNKYVWKEQQY